MEPRPIGVLFVCLGNICRSPLAEGILKKKLRSSPLAERVVVDSAGLEDYHVGEPPDPRTVHVARQHGITLEHTARLVTADDFQRFDYFFVMDRRNLRRLRQLARQYDAVAKIDRIRLIREFDPRPDHGEVPDPYYGTVEDFERVYRILDRSIDQLLGFLQRQYDVVS